MSTVLMSPGQKSIEDRYEQIKKIPVNPDKSAGEQFGEMDSWMFMLGGYRLFLNPMTRRWYFFDHAHNYWKDINAPAGTVIFSLRGSELDMINTGAGIPQVSPAVPANGKEHRFCPQCGAPLRPGLKFCNKCGVKIS